MASIQPQQSATSIACFGVIEGRPEASLWILIQTSGSAAWWAPSQASKPSASANSRMRAGSTVTGAMGGSIPRAGAGRNPGGFSRRGAML